ncbi:MAG TPA: hypothetical protein DIC53_09115 [Synergistaceae bacterium]|nr:hypothetical protein [Synergistaceae bacterium]
MRPVHIVYVTAGNGHRMAAKALRESLDMRHVPNVIMDLLDFSSDLFKWSYSDVYAFVSEHAHLACRIMYDLTNKDKRESAVLRLYEKVSVENVKKFMRYVSENAPEECICTHFFPLNVLSRMKGQGLYGGKLYSLVTDYGLHRMWVNDHVDCYFVPNDAVRNELLSLGVRGDRIVLSGIPVLSKYSRIWPTKRDFSAERLSVLFISSSVSNSMAVGILRKLSATGLPLGITVVTGRNRDLIADIESLTLSENLSLNVLGFVHNLDELMARSSLLITKPGGLTVSEALCASVPMILVNPIPKQEVNNAVYLEENGAGILARNAGAVRDMVSLFHADRKRLAAMEEAASSIALPNAANTVIDRVLGEHRPHGGAMAEHADGAVRTEGSPLSR